MHGNFLRTFCLKEVLINLRLAASIQSTSWMVRNRKHRACLVFILQQPPCKQELVAVSCRVGCTDVQELSLACNVGNQEIRHVILKYGTLSITISSTS